MLFLRSIRRQVCILMTGLFLLASVTSVHARASVEAPADGGAMMGTHELIEQAQLGVERADLKAMLADDAVKAKMASLGVSPEQVEQRIDSLTAEELAYFNAQLDEAPAGAGVLGVIVLFLVVFIITDMLCATDIFPFVKCINR